ncbi:hypothetical protein [Novacetimonas maltaceti]|uniref:hypothetical protein n=1 Tax=Novacetimonas maltaceti TaxID=1203393 RepID=UPI00142D5D74|nr:hypothetical protein [Novacetimonas maltaceti]
MDEAGAGGKAAVKCGCRDTTSWVRIQAAWPDTARAAMVLQKDDKILMTVKWYPTV